MPSTKAVRPQADAGKGSDAGKILGGLITSLSSDEVELTLDDGRAAVISRRNFDDDNTDPASVFSVGDRAEGAVLTREDPKQRVVLSRAWALKKRGWERVAAAAENNELISGSVVSVSKRGVVVDAGVRGFVPSTHLDLEPPSDLTPFVGQTFDFRVLEVDVDKERLVLSRRSLLLKQQRKETHEVLAQLCPGETRSGRVVSLADYGAFVDLGGVNGLVHLSELSWRRVRHPSDVVAVGDTVEVKVLDVKVKKRRVSLSMRQLTPDPLAELAVGAVIEGPVCRLVDFGAFVDVGGAEGLVHLSEMAEYRISTPEEIVTPGEVVRAKILSVDRKRRRIELSIRQAVSSAFD
jgi:ribosomal protein S1